MSLEPVKAIDLLAKYGARISQELLTDMLNSVEDEEQRKEIQDAVEELNTLIETDEKGFLLNQPKELLSGLNRLPAAYSKGCIDVWLFDDAFISYNNLAQHYHGYRKNGQSTVRITNDELQLYKDLIQNPRKILDL
ncbi:MAG: hypothetical protein HWE34_17915 [Methylocystaceae bacterium]|nr:hypothetical protein [Methylocystaceae bacterium]